MERIMYVIRDDQNRFYWKNDNVSSSHGMKEGFENAHLFKSIDGAKRRRSMLRYHNIRIVPVIIKIED